MNRPDLNSSDAETTTNVHLLETPSEKTIRLLSLKIIYFTMFLMTLGFSIILTGIWPYLDKVHKVHKLTHVAYLTLLTARQACREGIYGHYRGCESTRAVYILANFWMVGE